MTPMSIAVEYFVPTILYIGLIIVITTSGRTAERRIQLAATQILVLCLILTVADRFDLYISEQGPGHYSIWRTICAWLGYAGRPLIMWCFLGMALNNKKIHRLLLIPVGINALVYLTGFWYNLAFYIDENNIWHRGPLGYLALIMVIAYILLMIAALIRRLGNSHRLNLIIVFTTISGIGAVIFEMRNEQPGILYPTVIAIVLFIYIYMYTNTMNKRISVQEIELKEQQISLSLSQLQPHFISNGMVTVRRLIRIDPDRAIEAMDYFIDYLRKTIDSLSETECVPVANELQFVEDYLYIEKLRFGEDLQYEIRSDGVDFDVPPFTLQPVVENAIRHGIRKKMDGSGTVIVEVTSDASEHRIRIMDNGVGFDPNNIKPAEDGHEHIGMKNTKYRIETMSKGIYSVESTPGVGTTVTIHIPIEKKIEKKKFHKILS